MRLKNEPKHDVVYIQQGGSTRECTNESTIRNVRSVVELYMELEEAVISREPDLLAAADLYLRIRAVALSFYHVCYRHHTVIYGPDQECAFCHEERTKPMAAALIRAGVVP